MTTRASIQEAVAAAIAAATTELRQEINQANDNANRVQQALADANREINELRLQQQQQAAQPPPVPPVVLPPPMAPAPPAVPPVIFAYTPGRTGGAADLIDYSTTAGAKVYKAAVTELPVEFDLDREHLYEFLQSLRTRAIACGWSGTLLIINQAGVDIDFLENYGTVTREAIRDKAFTYLFANTRMAQDSFNLFMCLEASLSTQAKLALYAESNTYTVMRRDVPGATRPGTDPEEMVRDGLLMLWAIINRTTAMTTATISVLMEQLSNLSNALVECNHDILAFNTRVRRLLSSYYANKRENYNETALLHNLARAYKSCKDEKFVQYIERKWSDHEDMTNILTPDTLMTMALKQYQTASEMQSWGVDTKQTKSIMTLAAKVNNFQKWKKDQEKAPTGTEKSTKEKSDKKEFLPLDEYRKKLYNEAPAWKKRAPKDLNQVKTIKGKKYNWCVHHKLWQQHTSDQCRINKSDKKEDDKAPAAAPPVRYNPTTLMAEVDDSDESL